MSNSFRWALRILKEIGYIVCPNDNSYSVKSVGKEVLALDMDPELKALINMKNHDSSEIVRMARKVVLFKASI
ncbi:MAG: hypothetical protein N4A40_13225 [Tissierellales bacterium]|jgi:hypothetical protein|nr:hypothetical protein [Tissierellales bacterium]